MLYECNYLFVGTNSLRFRLTPEQQAFNLSVFVALIYLFIAALMNWQLNYIYDARV